ncbi:MAG: hypothetical protein WDM80_02910 [Limisphaerales bacterium]
MRRLLIQIFFWAVARALTKLGIAMGIINKTKPRLTYPVIKPAVARPAPVNCPPECLIFEQAMCPQMMAGMAKMGPRQTTNKAMARIPKTRLQTASAEVFGIKEPVNGGGSVSFI